MESLGKFKLFAVVGGVGAWNLNTERQMQGFLNAILRNVALILRPLQSKKSSYTITLAF